MRVNTFFYKNSRNKAATTVEQAPRNSRPPPPLFLPPTTKKTQIQKQINKSSINYIVGLVNKFCGIELKNSNIQHCIWL